MLINNALTIPRTTNRISNDKKKDPIGESPFNPNQACKNVKKELASSTKSKTKHRSQISNLPRGGNQTAETLYQKIAVEALEKAVIEKQAKANRLKVQIKSKTDLTKHKITLPNNTKENVSSNSKQTDKPEKLESPSNDSSEIEFSSPYNEVTPEKSELSPHDFSEIEFSSPHNEVCQKNSELSLHDSSEIEFSSPYNEVIQKNQNYLHTIFPEIRIFFSS